MFSPNCHTFGQSRNLYGSVPEYSRRIRRILLKLLRLRTWAVAVLRRAYQRWSTSLLKTPLLPASIPVRITTAPLVRAVERKEQQMLAYGQAVTLPPSPLVTQQPAVETHAPCTTISTRGMDALLTEIRANVKAGIPDERAFYLIGKSSRWNGAKARA